MKITKTIVIFLLVVATTPAFAARGRTYNSYNQGSSSQFYLGVGLGSMKTDLPGVSNTSIPWSLFAGTSINQFLAAEVDYTNLGTTDVGAGINMKGASYSLNLVGKIPVTQAVSMFAKFGFANTGVYFESGGTAGTTVTKAAPTIGLGVQFNAGKQTDVRIAYDNYKFETTTVNPTTYNADITSLSVIFRF
jgi:hypothetical protein